MTSSSVARVKKDGKYIDQLTRLYNRLYFNEIFDEVQQDDIVGFGFVLADLNGLKLVNNTFGHRHGDEMILEAANLLKSVCSKKNEVVRMGGGEFAICVYDCEMKDLDETCEKIRAECRKFADRIIPLSISCGAALRKDITMSVRVLYRQAEGSMYRNKLLDNSSVHNQLMTSLSEMHRARNIEVAGRSDKVIKIAAAIGKKMELPSAEYDRLLLLALMHDIGEIAIPDNVIKKPDRLSEDEWMVMRTHCEVGCRIAMTSNELSFIANEIFCHHERWDGKGYPYGYKGEEIPLLSRITGVADTYSAITNDRVYKSAMSHEEAVVEMKRVAGTQLDPHIVSVFLDLFEKLTDAEMKAVLQKDH